jgi:hypothetical protein
VRPHVLAFARSIGDHEPAPAERCLERREPDDLPPRRARVDAGGRVLARHEVWRQGAREVRALASMPATEGRIRRVVLAPGEDERLLRLA